MGKGYYTFQGSFLGLEYVLCKGKDSETIDMILEIFNPQQQLIGKDFDNFSVDERFDFYMNSRFASYLDKLEVSRIHELLDSFSESDITAVYNAQELNDKNIYPEVWHNGNSSEQAFNQRHIVEDFNQLKLLLAQANKDKDYIFISVG